MVRSKLKKLPIKKNSSALALSLYLLAILVFDELKVVNLMVFIPSDGATPVKSPLCLVGSQRTVVLSLVHSWHWLDTCECCSVAQCRSCFTRSLLT